MAYSQGIPLEPPEPLKILTSLREQIDVLQHLADVAFRSPVAVRAAAYAAQALTVIKTLLKVV